jgi:hypothetical protein
MAVTEPVPMVVAQVACADCGRRLRGRANAVGKWVIAKHLQPDGKKRCRGHYSTRHRPA